MKLITIGAVGAALALSALGLAAGCTVTTTQTDFGLGDGGLFGDVRTDAKSGSSSSSSNTGSGSGGSGSCSDFCAKAASASCPEQSTCESDCQTQTSKVPSACSDAWDAVLACGASKGTFTSCDSNGKPKLTGCDQETQDFITCLSSGGTGTGTGTKDAGGGTTGGSCGSLQTGNATCDSCMTAKCCSQGGACSNDSECLAILDCFGNCSSNSCYTTCENQHPSGVSDEQALYACMQSSCATPCQ